MVSNTFCHLFVVLYRLLFSCITSQPDYVIGREMETAFLIVVPKTGWEPKYLPYIVSKESNGEIFFEKQFDFFRFMILSQ